MTRRQDDVECLVCKIVSSPPKALFLYVIRASGGVEKRMGLCGRSRCNRAYNGADDQGVQGPRP